MAVPSLIGVKTGSVGVMLFFGFVNICGVLLYLDGRSVLAHRRLLWAPIGAMLSLPTGFLGFMLSEGSSPRDEINSADAVAAGHIETSNPGGGGLGVG